MHLEIQQLIYGENYILIKIINLFICFFKHLEIQQLIYGENYILIKRNLFICFYAFRNTQLLYGENHILILLI
jgi:hypothetical protein